MRTALRMDTARSGKGLLTRYQAKRTRVAVRTVRRETAGPGMESLTSFESTESE